MTAAPARPRLHASGDSLLLVELEARIDPAVNARAVAIARALRAAALPGVRDVVPSYAAVGLHVDPLRIDTAALERAIARAWEASAATDADADGGRLLEIPVCYGGAHGPDLAAVAAHTGCDPGEVVRRHSAGIYRVYLLGFLPGFAYLGTLDERLAMPRRAAPRAAVPAGSVGIAGRQTGVYPMESPGGWQIIGRTPWRMFDPARRRPSVVEPGDRVRFVAIAAGDWDRHAGGPEA
jgi:KipI family sensor histidine kinase inhibitor